MLIMFAQPFKKAFFERMDPQGPHRATVVEEEAHPLKPLCARIEWLPFEGSHNTLMDGYDGVFDLDIALFMSGRRCGVLSFSSLAAVASGSFGLGLFSPPFFRAPFACFAACAFTNPHTRSSHCMLLHSS